MKILYVNTHFAPDFLYGGVVESSDKIFKYMSKSCNIQVVAVSRHPNTVNAYLKGSGRCYKSIVLHRWGLSFTLISGLWKYISQSDLIAINGIFTFPVVMAQLISVLQGKPFVVSVRGGLESWRLGHKPVRKKLFNFLFTFPLLAKASAIHVTSESESSNLKKLGFHNLRLIPNGVDVDFLKDLNLDENRCYLPAGKFVFLFLSRTDEEKGIENLLLAFKNLKNNDPHDRFRLAVIGPDHQGYLKKILRKKVYNGLIVKDGIYGIAKYKLIKESDCIVLPSFSENFGNIIAEGMAMAKPVIATTGTPWSIINKIRAGKWVAPNVEDIYNAMLEISNSTANELESMGLSGQRYVFTYLPWSEITSQLLNAYQEIYISSQPKY